MADGRDHASWSLLRRLTLGLALSVGGVLAALFVALDHWIDYEIYLRMDANLRERARAVTGMLQSHDLARLEQLMPGYKPDGHMEFFTVYDAQGHAVLNSSNSNGVTLFPGPVERGSPRYYDLTLPDGHAGRALATRMPGAMMDEPARMLVVASERESWDHTERRIHFTLLGAIALALLLAGVLGMLVVRRMFAVLHRSSRQVAALDADAPPSGIGDDFPEELRPFAAAFNHGIRHLYEAIDRERSFARDVAHELRTPLAEIRASAESALASGEAAEAAGGLRAAIDASARMQRSVDTLSALARMEAGLEQPVIDPMDLASTVQALIDAVSPMAAGRSITLHAELPATVWVRSDRGIIERIVSNLLRNAIEYSPEGSAVTCQLYQQDDQWWLRIDNAAPNLRGEDLACFGQRFWRGKSEGGTHEHSGLGLSMCLGLARCLSLSLRFEWQAGRLYARLGPWVPL